MSRKSILNLLLGVLASGTVQADWKNISDSRKLTPEIRTLQNLGHALSASLDSEADSLMVQVYEQTSTAKIDGEALLREFYLDSMSPNLLSIEPLKAEDLKSAEAFIFLGLAGASAKASADFKTKFTVIYRDAVERLSYSFLAAGGRCRGLLLVLTNARQVVEIANCKSK